MNSILRHPAAIFTAMPATARAMMVWRGATFFEALSATPNHPGFPLYQGAAHAGGQSLATSTPATTAPALRALVAVR